MLRRPTPGEDEEDILKMQEEFLRKKRQNQNLQPAAQVVNLRTEPIKRPNTNEQEMRKPSKYAQSKGLKNHSEKRSKSNDTVGNSVITDVYEKNTEKPVEKKLDGEDDKVYYPTILPFVLGDIVEKNLDTVVEFDYKPMPPEGFPVVRKQNKDSKTTKYIYQKNLNKIKKNIVDKMDVDEPSCSNKKLNTINLPDRSYILTSENSDDIHNENIKILSKMSEMEILEEQQKLFSNLDPKVVDFIKSRRMQNENSTRQTLKLNERDDINKLAIMNQNVEMDTSTQEIENDTLWENDVLSHPEIQNWLHFDSLEKDKLQWMEGLDESKNINPDEPYEARFDFKGYLLPYTMEYTDMTKTLYHHGEEPHRPGYTVTELIELTRSTITQQRVMALNTIAGILQYHSAGTYKDIIEIPLSKLFFIIRIAMDENKVIILEPALKAMRNLVYNKLDEASLDALIGFEEGNLQPCFENDKSEIEELESKEAELKDFHLAEIDIIAALLRTDILQRIYYILESIKPSFNCVQYCLQILTRLGRDSVETAKRICEMEHLMNSIITNFVPVTGVNFVFKPQVAYNGKPVLAAIKLLRVLSLQTEEICNILLMKYNILAPISVYLSSAVDRSYGLRIQTESYCILSNLLYFGLSYDSAISLCPVILTALYKHVQGTDINVEASVLAATHAAVVLQLINNILKHNLNDFLTFKIEVYKLLKEGLLKWFGQLSQMEHYTCAHLRILCSALDCCYTVIEIEQLPVKFVSDALKQLSYSKGFENVINNLSSCSNLLSKIENKDLYSVKNLISLKCTVIDSAQKVLPILKVASPIPLLTSLFKLLTIVNQKEISRIFLDHVWNYLQRLSKCVPSLSDNWFTRMETNFVFYVMKLSVMCNVDESKKDVMYAVANKLCYTLRVDKKYELDFLFESIVFNKDWFTAERLLNLVNLTDADGFSKALTAIGDIRQCYRRVINLNYKDTGPNVVLRKWMEPILPRDWIYLPILMLYSKNQEAESIPHVSGDHAQKMLTQIATEKEFIITCSLEWILFNELCFSDLVNDIDVTDRFCRIMCVFLCDNSLFLQPKIRMLLQKCTNVLFKKKSAFNFDKQLTGLNNFQDFYTQFLEQFQAVSYGDDVFSACVLVPLAQKHNVKWRKLIWSEYAGCLRALDCPEQLLCYEVNEYLYPEETDESLIKSYHRALSCNLLRPDTIMHKIASHHVHIFKNRSQIRNT